MRTRFLGVPLDVISATEAEDIAVRAVTTRHRVLHCSLNALKVVEAHKEARVREILSQFDLITADGMSIVWGLRLLGQARAEQIAGVDLMARLLRFGAAHHWGFFLLGADPSVAPMLKSRVEAKFPGARVVGARHGYFTVAEEAGVVDQIRKSGADVLFVGMPSPAKEEFLVAHREEMAIPFAMGVGGGLDLLAGKTRRAPGWMRRSGLEWSYRVIQEPRRLALRYLTTNLQFAGILAGELVTGRRSRRSASC